VSKLIDLTNQKFGRLLVIERSKDSIRNNGKHKTMWLCECQNDKNKVIVSSQNLRNGHVTSCGCYKSEQINKRCMIDLMGQRFGKLLVIKREKDYIDKKSRQKFIQWLCQCDCGNKTIVRTMSLRSKNGIRSCNKCSHKTPSNFINLKGRKFGYLIVIERSKDYESPSGNKQTRWLCKCENDENEIVVLASNLLKGNTKSCGCLNESWIASELKKYYKNKSNAKTEYGILKNPKTKKLLYYDIFIPKRKIFIEIHGEQHYKFIWYWHITQKKFKYNKRLDKIKEQYAKQNGIYVEIDLRKIKTTEQAIKFIEERINNGRL
jgi:predicted RNA-binding Zn-ribbon protein involved in translation (DUF1610 family)